MYYLIALVVFIIDQISKRLIKTKMNLGDIHPVWGDFFIITSHRNQGAAFGILQGQQVFFLIITVVFVIGIFYYLQKTIKMGYKRVPFALCLMLGGAIGNFLDRAIYGEVVDFLQFTFKFTLFGWKVDYIYPIFNVADAAIVTGTIIILLDSLISWRREIKEAKLAAATGKDTTNDPD
ncbi:MAG: signal peptidase II [Paenibacillaceae bacterium]